MSSPVTLRDLGLRLSDSGGEIRVFSDAAHGVDVLIYDRNDQNHVAARVGLRQGKDGVWAAHSDLFTVDTHYALQAWGPAGPVDAFSVESLLVDPYAKGLEHVAGDQWRGVAVDTSFDWEGVEKPATALSRSVIYEAHVRGLTKQHPGIPLELRGTYAGLGHEAMTSYLSNLGVTAIELLPIHAFAHEKHLEWQGLINYWGYNTVGFFAPHADYATAEARAQGATAVLREVKQMIKNLHAAGIEVILDVVYNHTAEEGSDGPTYNLRGLDNAAYYRLADDGSPIDVTGCGNSLNSAHPTVHGLIMDSLRYWAREVQVDGFRFDLATVLGRDAHHDFTPDHPLLLDIRDHPDLDDVKIIAEPWDVGFGGWQTGNFPRGWSEWNDQYRDTVREFWLSDISVARETGTPPSGVGRLATRLAGSSNTFAEDRGPVASINFVTAHDGFTLADLTTYNHKHNIGNGEDNRDGANENRSFNHGDEGPSDDPQIVANRRKSMRNLMGTLLLSAGVPMIVAGDEHGRTQHGNNNAYCHDSPLTWVNWELQKWQEEMLATTKHLIRLRKDYPALRPENFGRLNQHVTQASAMAWYNAQGLTVSDNEWQDPSNRTLQYLASSTADGPEVTRILVVVHGTESPTEVVMPAHPDVTFYEPLWFSTNAAPRDIPGALRPGETIKVGGTCMLLFGVE